MLRLKIHYNFHNNFECDLRLLKLHSDQLYSHSKFCAKHKHQNPLY
jgi:hypothetical protein